MSEFTQEVKVPSELLKELKQQVGEFHVLHIKLYSVTPNKIRPDGFKLNCVLIDLRIDKAVLILDNHEPFGYHIHPEAGWNHNNREEIIVSSPLEAIKIFQDRVKKLIGNIQTPDEGSKNEEN